MTLRLAKKDDVDSVMEIVKSVIPAMHQAGNYQWNADYPTA